MGLLRKQISQPTLYSLETPEYLFGDCLFLLGNAHGFIGHCALQRILDRPASCLQSTMELRTTKNIQFALKIGCSEFSEYLYCPLQAGQIDAL
jgi:hypothetical protein